jgi:hypothetical protein
MGLARGKALRGEERGERCMSGWPRDAASGRQYRKGGEVELNIHLSFPSVLRCLGSSHELGFDEAEKATLILATASDLLHARRNLY